MEPVVLLIAVAGFALWYILSRVLNRGTAVVMGEITGNTRQRGLAAVHLKLDFTAPVSGPEFVHRLMDTLELSDTPKFGLVAAVSDDYSTLGIINRNWAGFEFLEFGIDTEPTDGGCSGWAQVIRWQETEGRVDATESIERIQHHVRAAVEHFGGTVQESTTLNSA